MNFRLYKTRLLVTALCATSAFVIPKVAAAGTLTLHPAGFGEKSYSAWKAKQGLPDSKGNDNQALYFQKMTTSATIAAGAAVIKGVAGLPVSELTGLAWDHREDGHCGAGAPRWNVVVHSNSTGNNYTVFLGCNAADHTEKGMFNEHGWCRDTQPSPPTQISTLAGNESPADLTITSLSILFDEGNDTLNPPPAGCTQEQIEGGFVYLDNIQVTAGGVTKCWTSANDNSNNSTGACADPPAASPLDTSTTLLNPLTGIPVDPTDIDVVTALTETYADIPLSSWSLYPYVY